MKLGIHQRFQVCDGCNRSDPKLPTVQEYTLKLNGEEADIIRWAVQDLYANAVACRPADSIYSFLSATPHYRGIKIETLRNMELSLKSTV